MPPAAEPPPPSEPRAGDADAIPPMGEGDGLGPPPTRIRPLALALVIHRDHALLAEGNDPVKGERFLRALGGEIEFGERAEQAAARELLEELGREIRVRALLGVTENLFGYRGGRGHELVFDFVAEWASGAEPPDLEPLAAREGEHIFHTRWVPLAEIVGGMHRVYPEGLPERLAGWLSTI